MVRKAIALDIDGVILKGGKLIPGAKEAIQRLVREKIPFIFITNGGGMLEKEKALQLSSKLDGLPISTDQILQCHTPFQSLVQQYQKSTILVIGKSECLEVARSYGFEQVTNCEEIFHHHPGILPIRKNSPQLLPTNSRIPSISSIEAAFIFHDPVDWTLEMQVLSDVLIAEREKEAEETSNLPSNTSEIAPKHHKYQRIPLFASNADIVYAADYPLPRFTQGAFVESFRHLFQLYHQIPLQVTYFGKPYDMQYRYAEEMLQRESRKYGYDVPLQYFGVGDNPKSDIKGANEAGDHWHSILVRTGLFTNHRGVENDHEHPANHVCDSIVEAIDYILKF